jgi:putative ABC transport system permease protein
MARREGRAALRRIGLLTASASLGVGALVAINSFTDNLKLTVERQARVLLGADLSLSSRRPFTPAADRLLDSLACATRPCAPVSRVVTFEAMAYVPRTTGTRLVRVAAIEGRYPFYGIIHTAPEGTWNGLPDTEEALVDPAFLTGLTARPGDTLALGEARFPIGGTVLNFPGDVGVRAAIGPRVYIPARDLDRTRLLGFGSRAHYEAFVRLPDGTDLAAVAKRFRSGFVAEHVELRTVDEDQRELKSSYDQLGRYLGLVALIAVLLGGIGVGSAVQVYLRQKRDAIAVLRCLGATARQIFAVYLLQAALLGLAGSLLGVGLGVGVQFALPSLVGRFLPVDVVVAPSPRGIGLGLLIGVWVALAFALLPLLGVRSITPLEVLRRPYESGPRRWGDPWRWLAAAAVAASVVALALLQAGNRRTGLWFAGGIGAALLILWIAALGLIRGVRRWFPDRLRYVWRQGLANLYRPGNQTVPVVLALGFGGFLLATIALVQANLQRTLKLDADPTRPNLVFFDIQPDQLSGIDSLVRADGFPMRPAVPIVPMRILSVKGVPVTEILGDTLRRRDDGEPAGRWAFRREYRSTYRDTTVASEKVIAGKWWDPAPLKASEQPIPISIEVSVASELNVTLGDEIVWDVQGVPLATRITSLREVNWARFEPNFFVVFPPGALDRAPQTLVTLTRVEQPEELGRLQRQVVERFPNVTSIDVSLVQRTIERIIATVTLAIRFMALLSLGTGLVVLLGALAISRFQRLRESVLLRTLGASRSQVLRIALAEYLFLGLLAAVIAMALAVAAGWGLMKRVFETSFRIAPWPLFELGLGLAALTVLVGIWNSREVVRKAPLEVLRAEE